MYFGKPSDLPDYCTNLGKPPPAYSNIGEFFLEVVDEYEAADNVKVRYLLALCIYVFGDYAVGCVSPRVVF